MSTMSMIPGVQYYRALLSRLFLKKRAWKKRVPTPELHGTATITAKYTHSRGRSRDAFANVNRKAPLASTQRRAQCPGWPMEGGFKSSHLP